MRVTFVALGYEQLPVSLLAAIARREGHEVGLAFSAALFDDRYQFRVPSLARLFDDRQVVIDAIAAQQPDVLAFSALTNMYGWMLDIAREAKQMLPNVTVVFGGVHPSASPDYVLSEDVVDYVCVGEGDLAFPALLAALENGGPRQPIANLRWKAEDGSVVRGEQSGFIQDLDQLPFFDKSLWEDYVRVGDFYITMASRGCPYRCTFCFNNFFARLPDGKRGKYVRQRSVDHMMGELIEAKRRYGIRFVDFEDDIFTVDKVWLRAFLDRYKREIGVPFQILTHAKYIDDEVSEWLYEAGCGWAQMGIQSLAEEFKTKELRRYEKNDAVLRAMDSLTGAGIKLKADHIFGLPGEPPEAQRAAHAAYSVHTPARIGTFWATYFPGTEMVEQGRALGILTDQDVEDLHRGDAPIYHLGGHVAPDELRIYQAYELLFKMLPLIPQPLRSRVPVKLLERIPVPVAKVAEMAMDLVNAAKNSSYEHVAYGVHYGFHAYRAARRALGFAHEPSGVLPPRPPTKSAGPDATPDRASAPALRVLAP